MGCPVNEALSGGLIPRPAQARSLTDAAFKASLVLPSSLAIPA
jgi:hypothetical protein